MWYADATYEVCVVCQCYVCYVGAICRMLMLDIICGCYKWHVDVVHYIFVIVNVLTYKVSFPCGYMLETCQLSAICLDGSFHKYKLGRDGSQTDTGRNCFRVSYDIYPNLGELYDQDQHQRGPSMIQNVNIKNLHTKPTCNIPGVPFFMTHQDLLVNFCQMPPASPKHVQFFQYKLCVCENNR